MKKLNIILVENDTKVINTIENTAHKLKHEISYVLNSYTETIETIQENKPDIILLNIHLSSSIDVMDTILEIQKHKNIPIIYITNFFDNNEMLRTLRTDPIGYLQKPFKSDDLKSMLVLALHKIGLSDIDTQDTHLKHLGFDYYYDLEKENLYFKKLPIKLGVKEKLLLTTLVKADGELVSFDKLEYNLWEGNPVSESSLRTTVYRLRNKLKHKIIETVPSFGIKFIKQ